MTTKAIPTFGFQNNFTRSIPLYKFIMLRICNNYLNLRTKPFKKILYQEVANFALFYYFTINKKKRKKLEN